MEWPPLSPAFFALEFFAFSFEAPMMLVEVPLPPLLVDLLDLDDLTDLVDVLLFDLGLHLFDFDFVIFENGLEKDAVTGESVSKRKQRKSKKACYDI